MLIEYGQEWFTSSIHGGRGLVAHCCDSALQCAIKPLIVPDPSDNTIFLTTGMAGQPHACTHARIRRCMHACMSISFIYSDDYLDGGLPWMEPSVAAC